MTATIVRQSVQSRRNGRRLNWLLFACGVLLSIGYMWTSHLYMLASINCHCDVNDMNSNVITAASTGQLNSFLLVTVFVVLLIADAIALGVRLIDLPSR